MVAASSPYCGYRTALSDAYTRQSHTEHRFSQKARQLTDTFRTTLSNNNAANYKQRCKTDEQTGTTGIHIVIGHTLVFTVVAS
jgi:hypothetical protein